MVQISKRVFIVGAHPSSRGNAVEAVKTAPDGFAVTVAAAGRTLPQNAKFHALCTDISKAGVEWAGKRRDAARWKVLLVSGHAIATGQGAEMVPGLEGEFVNLRESTALMSKTRSASLIEYTLAFCAEHDVPLNEYRLVAGEPERIAA